MKHKYQIGDLIMYKEAYGLIIKITLDPFDAVTVYKVMWLGGSDNMPIYANRKNWFYGFGFKKIN